MNKQLVLQFHLSARLIRKERKSIYLHIKESIIVLSRNK